MVAAWLALRRARRLVARTVTPFNFLEVLKAEVAEAIRERAEQLGKGMAKDWGDYQKRVGVIEGYTGLERIITELTEDKKPQ